METFREVDKLVANLQAGQQICIDGLPGAGKSTLANGISLRLNPNYSIIRVDSFMRSRQATTVKLIDCVDAVGFRKFVAEAPAHSIVEGVLLRQLVASNKVQSIAWLYVKRLANERWDEGEVIERGELQTSWFHEQVYEYHRQYAPHTCAQYTFEVLT
jgi:ABC-type molybdenum transport system ATPase subunit/photorepair protein PhrA